MQLESVRLFRLIVSMGNISKAAAAANLSQPALSQIILRLEKELGCVLLERSNKGVKLTEAGQVLNRYAGNITDLFDNLLQDMDRLKSRRATVRIAASPVVGLYGLPCTMFQVKSEFPTTDFSMATCPSLETEQRLQQGAADIGFRIDVPKSGEFISKELYSDKIYLVCSADFAAGDSMRMEDFYRYPLVVQSKKSSLYATVKDHFLARGHDWDAFKILFELDSIESVKSSVLQGHGMAFLPYLSIKKELYQKQLRIIQLEDFEMCYNVYIIYRKKSDSNDSVYRIARYFSQIGAETFC